MRIGVLQFKPILFDVEGNLKKALDLMKDFRGDLLILPELAFSGYLFNSKSEIEKLIPFNDMVEEELKKISREKSSAIVFGFPEKSGNKFYNSSMLLLPNGKRRVYRKTHLFFEEKLFFEPGNTGFFVEEFRGVKIGLAICFDWFFPESFRTLTLMGADIIAHSANLVMPYCQDSNVYASLQNRVYIATANRWGKDENGTRSLEFTGKSQITSPSGKIIARASEAKDVILEADIDISASRDKHLNSMNDVFKDRRPGFYIM